MKPLLKICKVFDLRTLYTLGNFGVDYIGFHVIYDLPGQKQLHQYQKMIQVLQKSFPKTKSVLVTRQTDINKLVVIYEKIPTDIIQLHSRMNKASKLLLLNKLLGKSFDVSILNVISAQKFIEEDVQNILGRFVLIDQNYHGGTGKQVKREFITNICLTLKHCTILLAGGIDKANVAQKLRMFPIHGVDVQSSLEKDRKSGEKDYGKLEEFMSAFRQASKNFALYENSIYSSP